MLPRRPRPGLALLVLLGIGAGAARAGDNPWHEVSTPAKGPARSIGSYRAGCIEGAATLAGSGKGFRIMRPGRHRFYGHPSLVDFILKLAADARKRRLGILGVGDLGQPRGGPAPNGHASHQNGLDVDIDYAIAGRGGHVHALPMVNRRAKRVTRYWGKRIARLLRLAAEDPRVDRIFVNPVIKRELCAHPFRGRAWLRKLRPWWGHDRHFHVRLACPEDSPLCEAQPAVPAGDGCDQLDWWFSAKSKADRNKGHSRYKDHVGGVPELPEACDALLPAAE